MPAKNAPLTALPAHAEAAPYAARRNPVRGRLNAGFFRSMDGYLNRIFGDVKPRLFRDLPETVVEIGAGTGANFRYFAPGTRVLAVEPNPFMHKNLCKAAAFYDIDLEILPRGAEATALPKDAVEAVISTLVLCTVPDPAATIREVLRILRPGGRFLFLEHVAAPRGTATRRLQEIVHRPWSWCFEGCHTHRDTLAALQRGGFTKVEAEQYRARSPFLPVNPQIAGVATK